MITWCPGRVWPVAYLISLSILKLLGCLFVVSMWVLRMATRSVRKWPIGRVFIITFSLDCGNLKWHIDCWKGWAEQFYSCLMKVQSSVTQVVDAICVFILTSPSAFMQTQNKIMLDPQFRSRKLVRSTVTSTYHLIIEFRLLFTIELIHIVWTARPFYRLLCSHL